ncbi:MAG TPA: hypothetical protein PLF44_07305 [Candidatus Mcinerneyibacteriales bacterium]|jgi:hypothetical protein|nr:hypothetical protein [Candidatus Mcinerneyibacteriales bacterium]HPJ70670.1 hypothetical protein [Candidatus Mcinerneyibacteriales bacterium]
MKKLLILILFFAFWNPLRAEKSDISVLSFPYSVRALGAGNSFDPEGRAYTGNPFWADGNHAYFSTSFLPADIRVHYISAAWREYFADLIHYNWGEIEGRDEWGELTRDYRSRDTAFSLGYRKLKGPFRLTGSVRFLFRENGPEKKTFFIPALAAGWKGNAFMAGGSFDSMGKESRINLYGGASWRFLTLTARWESTQGGTTLHGGAEWAVSEAFSLVSGFNEEHWTGGMVLRAGIFILEYATQIDDGELMANIFSLSYRF